MLHLRTPVERLIFGHSVEAFGRAVRVVLDEGLTLELAGLGIDLRRPLLPSYPVDTFRAALLAGARKLSPGLPESQQLFNLGTRYADSYGETLVGAALKVGIRLLGPKRTLDRLARQFRTANNYSESRVTSLGPTSAELWCNEVTHPEWYRGLISRMLTVAGATEVSVTLSQQDAAGALFVVRWA